MRRKVKIVVEELSGGGFKAKVSGGFRRNAELADDQLEELMKKVSKTVMEMMKI